MKIELLDKFKNLPNELINIIISYTDKVAYRNGKYINRGRKYNSKYSILYRIPRPISVGTNKILLKLINYEINNVHGYLIEYTLKNGYLGAVVKFVVRETDGFDRYYQTKSNMLLIFDANSKWSKIVDYEM